MRGQVLQGVFFFCVLCAAFVMGALISRTITLRQWTNDVADKIRSVHAAYAGQSDNLSNELRMLREQNEEFVKIALFLRENYKAEIASGRHSARSFSDIINGYLAMEREAAKKA